MIMNAASPIDFLVFLHSLIKTYNTPSGKMPYNRVIKRFFNHRKRKRDNTLFIVQICLLYVPPQNDTEQSTQLTESQRRHRLACPST